MNLTENRFLRAIGFGPGLSRNEIKDMVAAGVRDADTREYVTIEKDVLYAELCVKVSDHAGICIRGEFSEDNSLTCDYYFPYAEGDEISSNEEISVERQLSGLAYSGMVDEYKLGISLIFYVQSIIKYLKRENEGRALTAGTSVTLVGLSDGGTILMPISKNADQKFRNNQYHARKSRMLKEAVNGNEDAIENLTMQDMDTQNIVNKMACKEDLYSLVDTYFMPYGLECELYSIMGEIKDYRVEINKYTGKSIYIMNLDVNDVNILVSVSCEDVVGEIEVGRRYKGVIWLQGNLNFPD